MAQGTKSQTAASAAPVNGISSDHAPAPGGVNRKKQKRREKQAAKQAAEALKQNVANARNGHALQPKPAKKQLASGQPTPNYAAPELDDPEHFEPADPEDYSDEEGHGYPAPFGTNGSYQPGYANTPTGTEPGKKSKKKKKAGHSIQHAHDGSHMAQHQDHHPQAGSRRSNTKDRIWNTSTSEERERIKDFWLSLGEDERKSLVKIEKEAVLRKMKEQQKHSCSCTVCGRKRTAIEEELEVLYDAYYEELEQYANHQQDGSPMLPPPSRYAQTLSSMPPGRHMMTTHPPSRIHELADEESEEDEEEEGDEEDYSDDEDEDYPSEEEPMDLPRGTATDFFNFGNSLTVKGGILTVADDLLKNDGKKFIEMMEQLAERRMQREEEAQYAASNMGHPSMYSKTHGHNHGAPPEEEDYEDDEEDDYDDDEEYEDEEEEEEETEAMTEEQRMEEGRRMFQIFAARMFEQRVLTAYREKVAAERQARLLEELAEEDEKKDQHAAKKAKEAQKRKEKKEKQKAAKAEEKARKEAEKAAQEAAAKAAEEKRLEEQRKKKEEQRKKKELERKAQEEERQRKEAERLKRQQEERERQQEVERKAREQKALEKRIREEAKKKEREDREDKEREAREKKAQDEKERREREAKNRAEKERSRKEEQATAAPTAPSRKSSQPVAVALPPGLLKQNSSTGVPSPLVTPAIPKAPTPNRPRQSSQQGSHGSSPKTPHVAFGTSKSMSPAHGVPHGHQTVAPRQILTKPPQQPLGMHHPQPASPMPPIGPPPGMQPPAGMGMPGFPPGLNGFPHSQGQLMHGMMGPRHPAPMFPPPPSQGFRPPFPPGMHPPNQLPLGRGFLDGPPGFAPSLPGISSSNSMAGFGMAMPSHSRQASGSFDKQAAETPTPAPPAQPIARPAPIQRPSSVKPHDENRRPHGSDVDELASHLGSKALLGDDEPEYQAANEGRRTSIRGPGLGGTNSLGFNFPDGSGPPRGDAYPPFGSVSNAGNAWTTPPLGFPMSGPPTWGSSPTAGLFTHPFLMGGHRQGEQPHPVVVRRILCNACRELAAQRPSADGYYDVDEIYEHAQANRGHADPDFTRAELIDVCDIFGNPSNGGGSLEYKEVVPDSKRFVIKFEESGGPTAALGEIGSPLPGHSVPASGGFGARPFGSMSSPHF